MPARLALEKDKVRDGGNARKVVGADITVLAFTLAIAISSAPSPNLGRDRDDAWIRAIAALISACDRAGRF